MTSFAHVVNPFLPGSAAALPRIQAVTLETMRLACIQAAGKVTVELLAACYPEDTPSVPADFVRTRPLLRSILDIAPIQPPRKLPLLADILQRGYESSTADFLIYSNIDISLQPNFYEAAAAFVAAGHDAFVINRRTIPDCGAGVADIPSMLREVGRPHPGWDCFVFRRVLVPQLVLGDVFIGAPRSGLALLANLEALAANFHTFTAERLTFHLGDEREWASSEFAAYVALSRLEVERVLDSLEARYGRFPRSSISGSFLWRKRLLGPFYETWSRRAPLPPELARALNRLVRRDT